MESTAHSLKAGRPKGPVDAAYHVLRLDDGGDFEHLTNEGPVKAKSQKGALTEVGAACDGKESFLILKEGQFKIVTPRTETETVEVTRKKFLL